MDAEELTHKRDLLKILKKRLWTLEKQNAAQGIDSPADVVNEINEKKQQIQELEMEIESLTDSSSVDQKSLNDLEHQKTLIFEFLKNPQFTNQLKRFVNLIEQNSRFQAYIEMCEELIKYLEESRNEKYVSVFVPSMRKMVGYVMKNTNSDKCYYMMAKLHLMKDEYEECINTLQMLLEIEEVLEYRYTIVDAFYRFSVSIYNRVNNKIASGDIISDKDLLLISMDKIQKSRDNLTKIENLSERNFGVLQKLNKHLNNIQEQLDLIERKEVEQRREQERLDREKKEREYQKLEQQIRERLELEHLAQEQAEHDRLEREQVERGWE